MITTVRQMAGRVNLSVLPGEITNVVEDFIEVRHVNSGLTTGSIAFAQQDEFIVIG